MHFPVRSFATTFITIIFPFLVATANEAPSLTSHCKSDEFAYLNADMSEIHYFPKPKDGWRNNDKLYELRKINKTLSLCASNSVEPIHKLTYRFGPPGKVEMERVATSAHPFKIFERSTSPHTGENAIFFSVGSYTYCVLEATAQGHGVSLLVLKDRQKILDLFSGTNTGTDYESGLIDINFTSNHSPALKAIDLDNSFQSACDSSGK